MMRSMYSAVSGLRVHQTKMDVIGNNIANVNTVGYKKGQASFQETFSQIIRGAGAPQEGKGGTNPQQIGLGVKLGSIDTIHTIGTEQRTDNPTDLMIDGEGFFVVSDDTNFENRYYTRAGNFKLDRDGTLVTADGYKVLGYQADGNGEITSTIGDIRINRSETVAPTTTKKIEFRGNLDSRVPTGDEDKSIYHTDTVIKDSLGNSYNVKFKFEKVGGEGDTGENTWELSVEDITEYGTKKSILKDESDKNKQIISVGGEEGKDSVTLKFDEHGKLTGLDEDGNFPELFLNIPKANGAVFGDGENDKGKVEIDYKSLTQYANDMSAKPHMMSGNTSGTLSEFSIDPYGVVEGIFTNGERKALGQIVLAKFDNNMGLQKQGNNFFVDTRNSGEPQLGKGGTSGYGAVSAGTLEMSNVDLSMEFTEMITTQRGFQANSRIITTSDEMLQELVNMKR